MRARFLSILKPAIAGAIGLAIAGGAMAQAKYQLRWGHYLPDGPFLQLEKDFANRVEQRTAADDEFRNS